MEVYIESGFWLFHCNHSRYLHEALLNKGHFYICYTLENLGDLEASWMLWILYFFCNMGTLRDHVSRDHPECESWSHLAEDNLGNCHWSLGWKPRVLTSDISCVAACRSQMIGLTGSHVSGNGPGRLLWVSGRTLLKCRHWWQQGHRVSSVCPTLCEQLRVSSAPGHKRGDWGNGYGQQDHHSHPGKGRAGNGPCEGPVFLATWLLKQKGF